VLDAATLAEPKTKALAAKLKALGWKRALVIDGPAVDANFARAAQNIDGLDVLPSRAPTSTTSCGATPWC
jgi:large subunit ribosomal protein L4